LRGHNLFRWLCEFRKHGSGQARYGGSVLWSQYLGGWGRRILSSRPAWLHSKTLSQNKTTQKHGSVFTFCHWENYFWEYASAEVGRSRQNGFMSHIS
jgi:hypothetical protein